MMNNFITVDRNHWTKLNSKIELPSYELLKSFIDQNKLQVTVNELQEGDCKIVCVRMNDSLNLFL